jgi:transcriptional regulator with XRE-family HTH domain
MRVFDHLDRALRHLREGTRTRQYQIAEAAGITKAMLSAYETGKQKPSLETLDKLLGALRCDLIDLHEALAVFQSPPSRETPGGSRRGRPRSRAAAGTAVWAESATSGAAGRPADPGRPVGDVYSALGIDRPLERSEEEVLGEVLTSFHKLIRHIHGRLHDREAESTRGARSGTGEPADPGESDDGEVDRTHRVPQD